MVQFLCKNGKMQQITPYIDSGQWKKYETRTFSPKTMRINTPILPIFIILFQYRTCSLVQKVMEEKEVLKQICVLLIEKA